MRERNWGAMALMATIAILLAVMVVLPVQEPQVVTAAPAAIPTPVAGVVQAGDHKDVNWFLNERVSADEASSIFRVEDVEKCDISWWIDLELTSGFVNTTTLKLQFSNDNVYWSDGASIDAAQATDDGRSTTGSGLMQQFAVFGRYARVYADVANTNLLTTTVQGVCK
jgi:hypothetical protein